MADTIIVILIVLLMILAAKQAAKHFRVKAHAAAEVPEHPR